MKISLTNTSRSRGPQQRKTLVFKPTMTSSRTEKEDENDSDDDNDNYEDGFGGGNNNDDDDDDHHYRGSLFSSLMMIRRGDQKCYWGILAWVTLFGCMVYMNTYLSTVKLLNQAQDVQIKPTLSPTMTPTYNPTKTPTRAPTPAPTTKEHMLKQLLTDYLPDPHEHFAGTKAWYWLIGTDTEFTPQYNEYEYVERYVAVHIFYQLNGREWKINPNFIDAKKHHCDWHQKEQHDKDFLGIKCDENNNNKNNNYVITHLDLAENNVAGSIPSELAALSGLKYLNLCKFVCVFCVCVFVFLYFDCAVIHNTTLTYFCCCVIYL